MRISGGAQLSPTQNLIANGAQASARNAAAAAGDPYWANVVLLAGNDNAADASTTFVDQSASAKTITAVGNAQYDTAQAPTGMTSSVLFDGIGDALTLASSADFGHGTGDLTIEWMQKLSASEGGGGKYFITSAGGALYLYRDDVGQFRFYIAGANRIAGGTTDTSSWHHYALARVSGSTRLFKDGVQVGVTYTDANSYAAMALSISNAAAYTVYGWMSNIRITKGVGRYSATFTPPTLPLPTS